ncbi:MAG TPA: hypothetical protein VMS77_07040 [Conexivisphaerales archaeon]|nr:hypothetical protein [Conexivisphaerales archaeon]
MSLDRSAARALLAVAATDAAALALAIGGLISISTVSLPMLNVAVVLVLKRRKRSSLKQIRSLPALAAAGTMVLQITGSRTRLVEMLSSSSVEGIDVAFLRALSLCYRGAGVDEAISRASSSLPYKGLGNGVRRIRSGLGLETVRSETAASALDLDGYYAKALGSFETRVSVVQGMAFFLPMLVLITFPRYASGAFGAFAVSFLAFSAMRYLSGSVGT